MASQLFTPTDLSHWLGSPVDDGRGAVVERVVWGWLVEVLTATERPSPVPDQLFAWALELGAIAHENPAGLSSKGFGDVTEAYSEERRRALLATIAGSDLGNGVGSAAGTRPRGSFPPAQAYPDPADAAYRRHYYS